MGEKFCRAVDYCIEHALPYMVISKSGGARMMESAFSLMQLAKTSGKLSQLTDAKLPFISMLTDPTFGGISASFGTVRICVSEIGVENFSTKATSNAYHRGVAFDDPAS